MAAVTTTTAAINDYDDEEFEARYQRMVEEAKKAFAGPTIQVGVTYTTLWGDRVTRYHDVPVKDRTNEGRL